MDQRVLTVAAILQSPQGQVLLQQRDNKPDLPFAGYWTLPGGKVEAGEEPADAIKREVQEEIGLEVTLKLWKVYERPSPTSITIIQYVFAGQIDQPISRLAVNEGQALRYIDLTTLSGLPVAYGFDTLLKEYFALFG